MSKSSNVKVLVNRFIILVVAFLGAFLFINFLQNIRQHNESGRIVDFGFHDVGELVTQEWYGRIVKDDISYREIGSEKFSVEIPFTGSRRIFSMDVEVLASIDFEKIDYEVSKDNKTITIKLPDAKIYKSYSIPETFKSYYENESWFHNVSIEEQQAVEDSVVKDGKKMALDSGILDKAEKNAKKIIEKMIKNKNKDINIVWQ